MSKHTLVHKGLVCALVALISTSAAVVAQSTPGSKRSSSDASSALPTSGGGAAFATKADAMVTTVEGFLQAEDYVGAEKAALELTEKYPEQQKGWMFLGYCRSRLEKFEESNAAYEQALLLGADRNNISSRKAYNLMRLGEFDEARSCYRSILASQPEDATALRQLGYVESKLGNLEKASYYYRRVLDKDPTNVEIIEMLAKIEEKSGNNTEVRQLHQRVLEADPKNTKSLGKLGLMCIKERDFQGAVTPLTTLVSLEPENTNARRNLGVAYYQLGDKRKAREQFEMVRELGGDMKDLYGPLADSYMVTGLNRQAMEVIKEGIDRDIQTAWLYCMWGKILENSNNYDAAISKFSKAVKLQEKPWSDYARKQIARQSKLKQRAQIISSQQGLQ